MTSTKNDQFCDPTPPPLSEKNEQLIYCLKTIEFANR